MVRRSPGSRFLPGAWAFPGGIVDDADRDPDLADLIVGPEDATVLPWLAAGFRELVEETGVWITDVPVPVDTDRSNVFGTARRRGVRFIAGGTAYFANWVTPSMLPMRFDTRFFLVGVDNEMAPTPDDEEIDAAEFVTAGEMLRYAGTGERTVPFPTQRILEQLISFASLQTAVEIWRTTGVVPVQPRIGVDADGSPEIVLPGDPRFGDMIDATPDRALLRRTASMNLGAQGTRHGGVN